MKGFKTAIIWVVAIALICGAMWFLASINGLNVTRTLITVNGSEITEGEYKFYIEVAKMEAINNQGITDEASAKDFLANGEIDGKPAQEYIKEKALNQVTKYELAIAKAKELNISLTEEEKNAARNTSGMEEAIASYGISENDYANVMEKSYLVGKYYNYLTESNPELFVVEDADVKKKAEESYALVQHVLILNAPQDGSEADENYAKNAKAKAEEVLAKAVKGENFANLISEYNEDPGMTSNPEGYLITSDGYTLDGQSQMVSAFTKGSFAVKPGKVNPELVESSYGWHIIKRCVIEESNENYTTIQENAKSYLSSAKFETYLDSMLASAEVVKREKAINKIKVEY